MLGCSPKRRSNPVYPDESGPVHCGDPPGVPPVALDFC
jgi:hypothetical protein